MYRRFSDFYDRLVFDIDYEKYANNILSILEKENINQANILEIACGTGNLTEKLARNQNFNIQAFDYSDQMLNHAFPKLWDFDNVQVFKFDMYKFPYEDYEYQAIVSILDVMNYILDSDKLEGLFTNIYKGLEEGGVFIFDLNSRYKLLEVLGNNSYVYEYEDIFYTWENTLEGDKVAFDLNFFIKNSKGSYDRFVESQVERYYSIDYISKLLESIGFKSFEYFDEDDGGPFQENHTQRILFYAVK